MIAIEETLVADGVLKDAFVCDLQRCKGACCVHGDAGAPLEREELQILDKVYPKVKPFMQESGVEAVEQQGKYIQDIDGEYVTPLIHGKECAYTIFENGIGSCSIEKAYREGHIDFPKPVSCHLYPIRVTNYRGFQALNYHEWDICAPACELGKSLKVPVYKFLKEPLIRKFGVEYFDMLEEAARLI